MKVGKRHRLIYWLNIVWGILLCAFSLFLISISVSSIRNLTAQEIGNRSALLKLNVDNVDDILENLERYIYLFFRESEHVVRLETGGTETEMFMAKQRIVNDLSGIVGWNEAVHFLFYYVPGNADKPFIRVSANSGMVEKKDALEMRVKEYIEEELESGRKLGKGYLLVKEGEEGYLIRFYKIRNGYIGMCLNGDTVPQPLKELTADGSGLELIRWVKENYPETVCIFFTCHAEFTYCQDAIRLGAMDYILKPIPYQELEQIIKKGLLSVQKQRETKHLENIWGELMKKPQEESTVELVKRLIAENISVEISRDELAKAAYMSPDYLTKLFKKETGMSLSDYIIQKRISLAKQLLATTDLSIVEISEKTGFSYSSYFVRIFKKKTDMTPQQYRNENKK